MKSAEMDMEGLALMSRLDLTAEEKDAYRESLQESLSFMDILKELDKSDVEPAALVRPIVNQFREDMPQTGLNREQVFANAPEEEEGAFKVPRII